MRGLVFLVAICCGDPGLVPKSCEIDAYATAA